MPTRRRTLLGALGLVLAHRALAEAVLTEDGLYREPWFLDSFLDLPEDVASAAAHGKHLAVLWELRGCPSCREMHLVSLAQPGVGDFIRERFEILQLNFVGSRQVTDFDGERLAEKDFARKYGVRLTPTIQFFPRDVRGLAARKPREREAVRMQGLAGPGDFRRTFAFVAGGEYRRSTLGEYLAKAAADGG